jgi:hypothetical protein
VARALPGTEPGEAVIATARASFAGAAAASTRAAIALGSARARHRRYADWAEAARSAGFPVAGPDFVVALTDRRLAVWQISFGLGRPVALAGDLPVTRVHDVAVVRSGAVTALHLVLTDGSIVGVEAVRGRRLRALAAALRARLA